MSSSSREAMRENVSTLIYKYLNFLRTISIFCLYGFFAYLGRVRSVLRDDNLPKRAENFGKLKNRLYICDWKDGRVVDCGGLENR